MKPVRWEGTGVDVWGGDTEASLFRFIMLKTSQLGERWEKTKLK